MKKVLLFLLLLPALARAQTYPNAPLRVDITGYKGNTVSSDSLTLLPSDTLKSLTVAVSYREGGVPVPALAPTLIRKKLKVVVRWTISPPFTDGWYQLLAGGQAIRYGAVHITTQGVILPNTSASLITSIITQLAQTFGAGKLNTTDTTAFVRKYAGYRLMSNVEGVKLAGLPEPSSYTATVSGINSAIDLLKPREFETFADAWAARATAPLVSQEWIVKHDETVLDNGVPQRIIYKWNGYKLYAPLLFEADGSPGTPSFNTAISDANARIDVVSASVGANITAIADRYTKAQVDSKLLTKVTQIDVSTYAQAALVAPVAGTTIEIWVAVDEKNGGGATVYKLKPNGDRYLTGFLIVKDN